jgi:transketolase
MCYHCKEGVINAPISLTQTQLEDLRKLVLRNISKDQVLILSNIPRVPASITSVLREISRRYNVPLENLREHARTLKDLKLIDYGEPHEFRGVTLTALGEFMTSFTIEDELSVTGNLVHTSQGTKPFGELLKDLRKMVLKMVADAGSGHLGASLSAVDILATLYFRKMQHDPKNPDWEERDRLILSKGHAVPALYAVLCEAGYIPSEELTTLREIGSRLQGHSDTITPGVDAKTGSLGQGLSIAVGMSIAAKLDKRSYRIYVIMGDGELQEGQVWEAAMTAAHHKLDNIVVFVDRNQYQLTGSTETVKAVEPLVDKWKSFGWNALRIDGHDHFNVLDALEVCENTSGKPSVLIADTTKGRGVSFLEGNKYAKSIPTDTALMKALAELESE